MCRKAIGFPGNQTSFNCLQPATTSKTDYATNGGSVHFEGTGPDPSGCPNNNCFAAYPNCNWSNSDASLMAFNGVSGERSEVSPAHITDGLSNVFFAGEKYLDANQYYTAADPADDNCALQGNDRDTNRWSACGSPEPPLQDTPGLQNEFCFGSAHPAGVNFVFCDGRVQLINYSISFTTYQTLVVRNYLAANPGSTLSDNY